MRDLPRLLLATVVVLAAIDTGRCLLPPTPIDIDSWRPGFFFRHVRVEGISHPEEGSAYRMRVLQYAHTSRMQVFATGVVLSDTSWKLIPITKPDRADGLLVVAEFPADFELDREQLEFDGMLGPMPEDVLEAVWKDLPRATTFGRLQVGRRPLVSTSLIVLAWAVVLLLVDLRFFRGRAGVLSAIAMLGGCVYLGWFVWLRFVGDVGTDDREALSVALFAATFGLALARMARPKERSALNDAEYAAANDLHDRL
ncbi:MAG: hypothetical protein U0228_17070 [Myxococcaceae bacterium]